MKPGGQGVDVDGYADALAPALQRAIGRVPWASGGLLVALYIGIGIRTGLGAYHFPRTDDAVRAGIWLAWFALMTLLAIAFWTLWLSSRLRWFQIRLRHVGSGEESPEAVRLLQSGAQLVSISQRVRPVIQWAMGLAVTFGAIGIGLLVVFSPHPPG